MRIFLVASRTRLRTHAAPNTRYLHAGSEERAVRVVRSLQLSAAIVEHRLDHAPARRLLRWLGAYEIPTLLIAEADDMLAQDYRVPIVSSAAPIEVVDGALRAVLALGSVPCKLPRFMSSGRSRGEMRRDGLLRE
ncbi:MAG: hypothetical protein ACXVEF_30080 [Polyangiales bacterium]